MARWTRISGTKYTAKNANYFREGTRYWFVRIEKATAGGDITVKVYDSQANATNGTSGYAASGTATLTTATEYTVTLANNGSVPPTFTGATVGVVLAAVTDTGTEVWQCDLGHRIERSLLMILRAAKSVSTITTVERGLRQWEDTTGLRPYVGIALRSLVSQPGEIGQGATSANSEATFVCVLHADPGANGIDDPVLFHFHDLRKAIYAAYTTAYDGGVNSGAPVDSVQVVVAEEDMDLVWARNRGTIEFQVLATIDEDSSEITGS